METARIAAANQLVATPIRITEKKERPTPKWSAVWRSIRPAGSGRPAVRFISASRSASYHMLSAAAAPAPRAMHRIAVKARAGGSETGATRWPHRPVKTTSVITRGLVSAKKSRQSAIGAWVVIAALFIHSSLTPSVQGRSLDASPKEGDAWFPAGRAA